MPVAGGEPIEMVLSGGRTLPWVHMGVSSVCSPEFQLRNVGRVCGEGRKRGAQGGSQEGDLDPE